MTRTEAECLLSIYYAAGEWFDGADDREMDIEMYDWFWDEWLELLSWRGNA